MASPLAKSTSRGLVGQVRLSACGTVCVCVWCSCPPRPRSSGGRPAVSCVIGGGERRAYSLPACRALVTQFAWPDQGRHALRLGTDLLSPRLSWLADRSPFFFFFFFFARSSAPRSTTTALVVATAQEDQRAAIVRGLLLHPGARPRVSPVRCVATLGVGTIVFLTFPCGLLAACGTAVVSSCVACAYWTCNNCSHFIIMSFSYFFVLF